CPRGVRTSARLEYPGRRRLWPLATARRWRDGTARASSRSARARRGHAPRTWDTRGRSRRARSRGRAGAADLFRPAGGDGTSHVPFLAPSRDPRLDPGLPRSQPGKVLAERACEGGNGVFDGHDVRGETVFRGRGGRDRADGGDDDVGEPRLSLVLGEQF